MRDLLWLLSLYPYAALIAVVSTGATGPAWRRCTAAGLAAALLALPFCLPLQAAVARAAAGIMCGWGCFRTVDLLRARDLPAARRVWHLVAVYDTRRARRVPPGVDWGSLWRVAGYALLAAAGWCLCLGAAPGLADARLRLGARWLGAAAAVYAMTDGAAALILLLNRLVGVLPPPLHDAPLRARSVQEFWSERWNRPVSGWLRANCLRPLLRRGWPRLGLLCAFGLSALLHGYYVLAAQGPGPALSMGAFFLAQFPIVMAERGLGVLRWPRPLAHAWTVTALLVSSPLFLEPTVKLVETLWRPAP